MPLTIKRLNCRVSVRTGAAKPSPLHNTERSMPRPSMAFAMPPGHEAGVGTETEPSPEHTASAAGHASGSQDGGGATTGEAQPRRADPRQVAERVYELMRDEIRLGRLRGGGAGPGG